MSKEQNIDDILKLLKDSVSAEQGDISYEQTETDDNSISTEALQRELKSQYLENGSSAISDNEDDRSEYVIDSDFLSDVEKAADEISVDQNEVADSNDSNTPEDVDIIEELNIDDRSSSVSDTTIITSEPTIFDDALFGFDNSTDDGVAVLVKEDDESSSYSDTHIDDDTFSSVEEFHSLDELDDEDDIEDFDSIIFEDDDQEQDEDIDTEADMPADNIDELLADLRPIANEPIYSAEDDGEDNIAFTTSESTDTVDDDMVFEDNADEGTDSELNIDLDDIVDTDQHPNDQLILDISDDSDREPHETFLASMRKTGIDFTTDDIYKSTVEAEDVPYANNITNSEVSDEKVFDSEETTEEIFSDDELDLSTINLMMQFCEKDELEEKIGDKKVEDFLEYEQTTIEPPRSIPSYNGKEYVDFGQNEDISEAYKKEHLRSLFSMLGCAFVALVAFVYELLPLLDVRMGSVFDYRDYPAVYALIGLQFIVFSAAICHKPLWQGLKRAFSLMPDRHSIISILLVLTVLYDLIIVILLAFSGDELPPLFNALAAVIVTLSSMADYLKLFSEKKAFEVYSSNAKKYTLVKEKGKGSIAEKLYSGGLDSDISVYAPHHVEFPRGFFRSVGAKEKKNKLLTLALIPTVVVGVIAMVIAILIGADAYSACAAFMICMYAILPIALIFADSIPYACASIKLAKRGSAVAGIATADKYSDCNVMVFNDLHIFKKCKTQDVGIAIYDSSVGYLVLGCIDALYSKIGGPLSGIQMNLPDVFKFKDVVIRRIARNGIEAVIDKKHSLVVGEADFMLRYGLTFPENETENERSTLCVSLNGKVTAKLSVKYDTEPIFEMLVERLYDEGISCVIQTYDPLINSTMITSSRSIGDAPIAVVHKNADDFYSKKRSGYRDDPDGVISCASRLKLAEVEVWLKKITKIKKICEKIAMVFSGIGAVALALLVAFSATGFINQLYLFIFLMLELGAILATTLLMLPGSQYFTIDALYRDLEQRHMRMIEKQDKKK